MSILTSLKIVSLALLTGVAPIPLVEAYLRAHVWPFRSEDRPLARAIDRIVGVLGVLVAQATLLSALGRLDIVAQTGTSAALLAAGLAFHRRRRSPRGATVDGAAESGLVAVAGALGLILFWWTATSPTTNYDSISFHLPLVVEAIRAGTFVPFGQFTGVTVHYPMGWEALGALFVIPVEGLTFYFLPNIAVLALLALGVARCAALLGGDERTSLSCGALAAMCPVLLTHVNAAHVDLPFAAVLVAAWGYVLELRRGVRAGPLVLSVVCAGLAFAARATSVYYVLPLLAAVGVIVAREVRGRSARASASGPRPRTPHLVALAIGLWVGGYWYVANLIATGNPFGYIEVEVLGFVLFPGIDPDAARATSLSNIFEWGRTEHLRLLLRMIVTNFSLPGSFLLLAGLAIPIAPLLDRRVSWSDAAWAAIGVGWTAAVYWTHPNTATESHADGLSPWFWHNLRYGFPCVAALGVGGALAVSALGVKRSLIGAAVVLSAALTGAGILGFDGTVSLVCAALALLLLGVRHRIGLLVWDGFRTRTAGRVAALLGVVILVLVTPSMTSLRVANRRHAYGAGDDLDAAFRSGDRVAYLLTHRTLLFYGPRLDRVAEYHPLREGMTRAEWLRELDGHDVDVIAVGPAFASHARAVLSSPVIQWLERGATPFRRVFGTDLGAHPFVYRRSGGGASER